MDKEEFLNGIARRLGRPRVQRAPERSVIGVPDFHRQAPLAGEDELIGRFCAELASVGAEAKVVRS
ncbi:MAG TPA: hypothetical protein VGM29_18105, partial [Polyangiaceae bacterium]